MPVHAGFVFLRYFLAVASTASISPGVEISNVVICE